MSGRGSYAGFHAPRGKAFSKMELVRQAPLTAELVISDCEEIAGTIEEFDLYGTTLWRTTTYFDDVKLYTTRDEAIAWLVYGMT